MDVFGFFTLTFCYWAVATVAASRSTEVPKILVREDVVEVGQEVQVTCIAPIDYGGGECRLFREGSSWAFRITRADYFLCRFLLPSKELLASRPPGSVVYFRCDYRLQQYTSALSNLAGVTVRSSSPSPHLAAWPRILTPDDHVEVSCAPPQDFAHQCLFYRGDNWLLSGPCTQKLSGHQLARWAPSTVLLPVNMSCRYDPVPDLDLRSHRSNHVLLLLVDPEEAAAPLDCSIPLVDGLNGSRTWVASRGHKVTVHLNNSTAANCSTATG